MKTRRTRRTLFRLLLTAALATGAALPATAQEAAPRPSPGGPDELRREMQNLFQNRLRAQLALSDEQTEAILPRLQEIEDAKRAARRDRMEVVRQLRRGLDQGATDDELQGLLDRLTGLERREKEREWTLMEEVDDALSTRQSVQLRFFTERFRRMMAEKIRELRKDGYPGRPMGGRRGRP